MVAKRDGGGRNGGGGGQRQAHTMERGACAWGGGGGVYLSSWGSGRREVAYITSTARKPRMQRRARRSTKNSGQDGNGLKYEKIKRNDMAFAPHSGVFRTTRGRSARMDNARNAGTRTNGPSAPLWTRRGLSRALLHLLVLACFVKSLTLSVTVRSWTAPTSSHDLIARCWDDPRIVLASQGTRQGRRHAAVGSAHHAATRAKAATSSGLPPLPPAAELPAPRRRRRRPRRRPR